MKKHVASLFQAAKDKVANARPSEGASHEQTAPSATAKSEADLQAIIYQGMRQFTPLFHIRYIGHTDALDVMIEAAMKRAIAKDDYIAGTISQHGYAYEGYEGDMRITIRLAYNTTAQKERVVQQEVKCIVERLITKHMCDVDKVQAINEWLVLHTTYATNTNGNPHAAHTIFTEHKGVCQAYAMAAYALLKEAGLRAHYVTGTITKNREAHAWNLVQVDGQWYHLDVTWNDPTWNEELQADDYISYEYFLRSEQAMRKTRTIDVKEGQPRATSERFAAVEQLSSTIMLMSNKQYIVTPSYYDGVLYSVAIEGSKAYTVQQLNLRANVPTIEPFANVQALRVVATAEGLYMIDKQRAQRISHIHMTTKRVTPLETPAVTHLRLEENKLVGYDGARVVWQQALQHEQASSVAYVDSKSGAVLREQPTKDSRTLTVVPQQTAVEIHAIEGEWVQATAGSVRGYMLKSKLRS